MARDSRDVEVDRSVEQDEDTFEWPDISTLRPAQAGKLYDELDAAARRANKEAKLAAKRKAKAKVIATQVMEDYEEESTRFRTADGKLVQLTPYEFKSYRVTDEAAFRAWAAEQDENFYDPEPRLREQLVIDESVRRENDGEELPPGVEKYQETRLSRTAIK